MQNHFDQFTISCLHAMYMTVGFAGMTVDSLFFHVQSSMEWRHKFVLIGIRASFPWKGTGRRKSGGTTDWDNVAVHFEI